MSTRARWLRIAAACLVGLALAAYPTPGRAQEAHSVDIASLDDSEFPILTAVVNVLDPTGKPAVGLTAEGFNVSLNGSPHPVDDVTAAVNSDLGVAVVLVVDVSGSMDGEPIAQAKAAARGFVEGLSPIDSVAVVSFSDEVTVLQQATTDRDAVFASLDGLGAVGNTALYQAATLGAWEAGNTASQRRAVILLSDGVDFGNKSTISRDDSIAAVHAAGVPFFTVGLGSAIDREYLSALSEGTGGQFLETPTPEGLSQLYQDIGDFLRSQYVITVNAEGVDETQPLTFRLEAVALGQVLGTAEQTLPARLEVAPPPTPALEPPQISVIGFESGQEVSEPLTMTVEAAGPRPVGSVAFLVDGQNVLTDSQPPFQFEIAPEAFAEGNHVLRIEATDDGGAMGATELSFIAAVPAAASGIQPAVLLIPVVLLAIVFLVAFIILRRRRSQAPQPAVHARAQAWAPRRQNGESEVWERPVGQAPAMEDRPLGKLTVTSGPSASDVFFVGRRPRRIGSAAHCDIVLEGDGDRISSEDARVWVSEKRLMFHKLTSLGAVAFEGGSSGWEVYRHGDEVRIGSHRLIFELVADEEPQPGDAHEPEAVADAAMAPGRDDVAGEPGSEPGDS